MKRLLLCAVFFSSSLCANLHFSNEESYLPYDSRELYINLLKRAVANTIYDNKAERQEGYDWPETAHTMVGLKRLNNIEMCMKSILEDNIPGDCVETGVWRGGSTILMRGILKVYHITDRLVWVCDSFQGLPPPNVNKYPVDKGLNLYLYPQLAVSLEMVQSNFSRYGLLDNQVIFMQGFFRDTLPTAPIEQIALLRLDGDLYESTMNALINLYPKLSLGGYVIIDDMDIPACAKAVNDYRQMNDITTSIQKIDWTGVYWRKES